MYYFKNQFELCDLDLIVADILKPSERCYADMAGVDWPPYDKLYMRDFSGTSEKIINEIKI